MVDARDLKSLGEKSLCRFESGRPHQTGKLLILAVGFASSIWLTGHADKSASEETVPPNETVQVGEQVELPQFVLACRHLDVLAKGMTIVKQNDLDATRDFFLEKMPSGECQAMEPGTKVVVQDSRNVSFVCIRRSKEPDCYWAMRYTVEAVEKHPDFQR
jgi:hypothetical protein